MAWRQVSNRGSNLGGGVVLRTAGFGVDRWVVGRAAEVVLFGVVVGVVFVAAAGLLVVVEGGGEPSVEEEVVLAQPASRASAAIVMIAL